MSALTLCLFVSMSLYLCVSLSLTLSLPNLTLNMPACWHASLPACPPTPSLFPDKKFHIVEVYFWLDTLFYYIDQCFSTFFGWRNPKSVFHKLFELADHKKLNKKLADKKILKTNSGDHEIEIWSSLTHYFNKNLHKILKLYQDFLSCGPNLKVSRTKNGRRTRLWEPLP